jgi:hypothetical protein
MSEYCNSEENNRIVITHVSEQEEISYDGPESIGVLSP